MVFQEGEAQVNMNFKKLSALILLIVTILMRCSTTESSISQEIKETLVKSYEEVSCLDTIAVNMNVNPEFYWDSLYIFYSNRMVAETTWRSLNGMSNYLNVDFSKVSDSKYKNEDFNVLAFIRDGKAIEVVNITIEDLPLKDPNFDSGSFYLAGYHNTTFYVNEKGSINLYKSCEGHAIILFNQ